ncbi:butyrophilin-like protein 2 isoform X1 [Sebastes fasciatus]|uniref:butyrophilin-like protein 2 isoform X1 n=1 Tax=Sebastes fasciatus TaxID=394691 RepID=UPI003D9E25DA
MLHQPDRLSLQSPLRVLSVLVFHLLLTHSCRGQSTLIGPLQPIVARVGDDVILPCHLEPVMDVTSETLEWKRSDLNPRYVHVLRSGQNLDKTKNPSYRGRTSLFTDELKRGNISLKLSKVQLSDRGTYECDIPLRHKQSSVKLVVVESELIGSPQQIVATVGDDVILPCHLEPAVNVAAMTLEWTRPDLNQRSVHVWRDGQDLIHVKDPSYTGRTSLFTDGLKHGNISLKLSKVKPSDEGRYKCCIPDMNTDSFIELVVGAVSSPVITLAGINEATGGVMLDCRSEGWYPEPEVLWLDGEGNLLSAGPPETVRGPDDLYTVSSRVTVEKRHSNSFTCRVQQKNTNQTRETHIQVPDDFFIVQSSSAPVITGLAVSLAVWIIMFILLLLFVVWKWRQIIIKTKRSCGDQTEKGEKKKHSKTNKSEDQCVTEEREREQLMTHETVELEVLKGNVQKKIKHFKKKRSEQQLQEEQQKEVQTLKEELLETKKNEIETKRAELQQLHEEKKRNENELQSLKEELEKKKKELERIINASSKSIIHSMGFSKEKQLKTEEVETLKKKLEKQQKESDANIKEFKEKAAEVQQLQDQIQRMETNLQTQMESNNMEVHLSTLSLLYLLIYLE